MDETKLGPKDVYDRFIELFEAKHGMKPQIPFSQCGRMISRLKKDNDIKTIIRVIELAYEKNDFNSFSLQRLLGTDSFNKYVRFTMQNPLLYADE